MGHNQEFGRQGESAVAEQLQRDGHLILDRNWRIKEGEIDLVAIHPDGLVCFVEVKTRSSMRFGHPLEAIDSRKAMRLHRLALAWLSTHARFGAAYRIDCASVIRSDQGTFSIDYRSDVA